MSRVAFTRFCRQIHQSARVGVRGGAKPILAMPRFSRRLFWTSLLKWLIPCTLQITPVKSAKSCITLKKWKRIFLRQILCPQSKLLLGKGAIKRFSTQWPRGVYFLLSCKIPVLAGLVLKKMSIFFPFMQICLKKCCCKNLSRKGWRVTLIEDNFSWGGGGFFIANFPFPM